MLAFCHTGHHEYTTRADIVGRDCPGHARTRTCNAYLDTVAVLRAWMAPLEGDYNLGDLIKAFRSAVMLSVRVTERYPGALIASAAILREALCAVAEVDLRRHVIRIERASNAADEPVRALALVV